MFTESQQSIKTICASPIKCYYFILLLTLGGGLFETEQHKIPNGIVLNAEAREREKLK